MKLGNLFMSTIKEVLIPAKRHVLKDKRGSLNTYKASLSLKREAIFIPTISLSKDAWKGKVDR